MTAVGRARLPIDVPLLAVSAAAWLALVVQPDETAVCVMASMRWSPVPLLAASTLMFAAMMVPLIGAPVAHVRDRSFAERRARAVALFVAGYGLPWLAAGIVLLLLAAWIVASGSALALAAAVAGIALWQVSPAKQQCLNRCHAHTELAAFGLKADLDVLRFGLTHAGWCIGACMGLMLLPMLFPRGHLALMAAVTLWLASERLDRPMPARWQWRGPAKIVRIARRQVRVWLSRSSALPQW